VTEKQIVLKSWTGYHTGTILIQVARQDPRVAGTRDKQTVPGTVLHRNILYPKIPRLTLTVAV
jgi:hypothetical protein